jgi:glutathione synthase/RimK-type ligase-like ATP-grasp enzyme
LVQEFVAEIQAGGELSLVFLGGTFSHAVVKRPQAGQFRSNSQYQGAITRIVPPAAILAQAQRVLAVLPTMPLYARVDGIISEAGAFLVLELELNEPSLYFTFAPEQAVHFATVIQAQLGAAAPS